jgi:VWFA-related protein
VRAEGAVQLDVVVSDGAGKAVSGLEPWNFTVLDNNQPRKILSFHAYDGITVKPDPLVEVVLVIDTANLPFQQVAFVRAQVDAFLRQDGGHLRQPVTLLLMSEAGMRVQPRPSVDGNALAGVVSQIKGSINTINPAMGGEGYVERFQSSIKQMVTIAENETRKPGRKLLVWVGPGWPMLNRPADGYSERTQRRYFEGIVELSTRLREARMVVYSVAPSSSGPNTLNLLYQDYLKGVKAYRQAESGNLGLKVLAIQTGGLIMGPDNDLVNQINRCIDDANVFYRISFNPPGTDHADEYHDLKVQVSKPGLTVHTNTSYYNQPPAH